MEHGMGSMFRSLGISCCCCIPGWFGRGHVRLKDTPYETWRDHPVVKSYELIKLLGEGGFSEVWLAQHHETHRVQALKVVYVNKPGLANEEVKVLEGEAKYLKMLDHPNILKCRGVLETRHEVVMVLDYLSGGEMLDHLHKIKHYSEVEACKLFQQVVSAVAYMHDLNLLHRDIKPENIMFTKEIQYFERKKKPYKVKLIDFGMAAVYQPHKEQMFGCLGSPGFIAPEVVQGEAHSPAMDIYSLGVLLFVMLCGSKPFDMKDIPNLAYARKSIRDAPGLKDLRFTSLSQQAQNLAMWMLHDDAGRRPTAHQVLEHPWVHSLGGSPPVAIDNLVKQRMVQLANARRYHGLCHAIAMVEHASAPGGPERQVSQDHLEKLQQALQLQRKQFRDQMLRRAKDREVMLTRGASGRSRGNSRPPAQPMEDSVPLLLANQQQQQEMQRLLDQQEPIEHQPTAPHQVGQHQSGAINSQPSLASGGSLVSPPCTPATLADASSSGQWSNSGLRAWPSQDHPRSSAGSEVPLLTPQTSAGGSATGTRGRQPSLDALAAAGTVISKALASGSKSSADLRRLQQSLSRRLLMAAAAGQQQQGLQGLLESAVSSSLSQDGQGQGLAHTLRHQPSMSRGLAKQASFSRCAAQTSPLLQRVALQLAQAVKNGQAIQGAQAQATADMLKQLPDQPIFRSWSAPDLGCALPDVVDNFKGMAPHRVEALEAVQQLTCDMHAMSCSPWALEFLGNQEQLSTLLGRQLARQLSSLNDDKAMSGSDDDTVVAGLQAAASLLINQYLTPDSTNHPHHPTVSRKSSGSVDSTVHSACAAGVLFTMSPLVGMNSNPLRRAAQAPSLARISELDRSTMQQVPGSQPTAAAGSQHLTQDLEEVQHNSHFFRDAMQHLQQAPQQLHASSRSVSLHAGGAAAMDNGSSSSSTARVPGRMRSPFELMSLQPDNHGVPPPARLPPPFAVATAAAVAVAPAGPAPGPSTSSQPPGAPSTPSLNPPPPTQHPASNSNSGSSTTSSVQVPAPSTADTASLASLPPLPLAMKRRCSTVLALPAKHPNDARTSAPQQELAAPESTAPRAATAQSQPQVQLQPQPSPPRHPSLTGPIAGSIAGPIAIAALAAPSSSSCSDCLASSGSPAPLISLLGSPFSSSLRSAAVALTARLEGAGSAVLEPESPKPALLHHPASFEAAKGSMENVPALLQAALVGESPPQQWPGEGLATEAAAVPTAGAWYAPYLSMYSADGDSSQSVLMRQPSYEVGLTLSAAVAASAADEPEGCDITVASLPVFSPSTVSEAAPPESDAEGGARSMSETPLPLDPEPRGDEVTNGGNRELASNSGEEPWGPGACPPEGSSFMGDVSPRAMETEHDSTCNGGLVCAAAGEHSMLSTQPDMDPAPANAPTRLPSMAIPTGPSAALPCAKHATLPDMHNGSSTLTESGGLGGPDGASGALAMSTLWDDMDMSSLSGEAISLLKAEGWGGQGRHVQAHGHARRGPTVAEKLRGIMAKQR